MKIQRKKKVKDKKKETKQQVKVLVVLDPLKPPVERLVDPEDIDAERLIQSVTGNGTAYRIKIHYAAHARLAMTLLVAAPMTDKPQTLTLYTTEAAGRRRLRGPVVIVACDHTTGSVLSMGDQRTQVIRAWQAAALRTEAGRRPEAMKIVARETADGVVREETPVFAPSVDGQQTAPPGIDPLDPFEVGDPEDPFYTGA